MYSEPATSGVVADDLHHVASAHLRRRQLAIRNEVPARLDEARPVGCLHLAALLLAVVARVYGRRWASAEDG
jgi:hypothetical protein